MYTWHALDIERFISIGDINMFGMVGAIYGSEITMISKKL